ncbi:MAG: DUF4190 domain-containing protein [Clostridiales bacterium]|nr:DUF4190 domain-containing protein [Clostridiales bacterium]
MEENNNGVSGAKNFNKQATASLILSLVGLLIAGIPCGIAAVVTGILGITKFDPETQKGKWMAVFGIVLGAIDAILVMVALPAMVSNLVG